MNVGVGWEDEIVGVFVDVTSMVGRTGGGREVGTGNKSEIEQAVRNNIKAGSNPILLINSSSSHNTMNPKAGSFPFYDNLGESRVPHWSWDGMPRKMYRKAAWNMEKIFCLCNPALFAV